MYTLSLLLPLSAVAQHPHAHALAQEIAGRQDSDGSWANDSVETALALHALRPFADLAAVRVRGTNWLLEEQGPEGSWNTDRPIWRFPAPGDDAWLALDSQNLVTTSLAIGALRTFPLTATKRKEQENG